MELHADGMHTLNFPEDQLRECVGVKADHSARDPCEMFESSDRIQWEISASNSF